MKVIFVQTWTPDCNIGRGYNEVIERLPDDCWVCITDTDSCFLTPNFGQQIYDAIEKHGKEYALIGCIVNRVGGLHQCHNNEFSNNWDMMHHREIAEELEKVHWSEVEETSGVAGVFMLFRKETWTKVGGFMEGSIKADTIFNKAIKRQDMGKIGLLKGLYMFHCYRMHESNHKKAWLDSKHLSKTA